MCDKRRGIGSCLFWLEDGGKKRIEKITESGCMMVDEMLRSKKIVEKVVHTCWKKKNNCV